MLYDGACNLCTAVVQFTIVRDRRGALTYAALQSDPGRRLLAEYGIDDSATDTFVFIDDGRAYIRSEAALRLVRQLSWPWPALSALLVVPRPLRDPIYRYVAERRYRWFGKRRTCMLMKPEYKDRFMQ